MEEQEDKCCYNCYFGFPPSRDDIDWGCIMKGSKGTYGVDCCDAFKPSGMRMPDRVYEPPKYECYEQMN